MPSIDAVTQTRQLGIEMIKRIEELPRPEKWRVTREFLLSQSKNASYQDHKFIEALNRERDQLYKSNGISKTGDSQYVLSMPDFVYAALIATDPYLQDELNNKDQRASSKAWRKLANAFPEYRLSRKAL